MNREEVWCFSYLRYEKWFEMGVKSEKNAFSFRRRWQPAAHGSRLTDVAGRPKVSGEPIAMQKITCSLREGAGAKRLRENGVHCNYASLVGAIHRFSAFSKLSAS